ncbi:hypothetical protein ACODYM_29295 [Burkholderia gladioli]|uniref:hypothetical protein n=1 Tax=Burkholderia gladioli TaxID=28095 RepID=UPI003B51138A
MADMSTPAPANGYPNFPLADQQDSKNYEINHENPVLASKMDGGYVVTRPRNMRRPRRTWTSSFTSMTDLQRQTLEAFYSQVYGGSAMFNWQNPQDGTWIVVRFTTDTTFNFKYVGMGPTSLWDLSFKVEEV